MLKGEKKRPRFKASGMEEKAGQEEKESELEQLREWGVDICAGQIERILNEGKERFHQEKAAILRVGLEVSDYPYGG